MRNLRKRLLTTQETETKEKESKSKMTIHEAEKRLEEIFAEQSEIGEAVRYLVSEQESLKQRLAAVEQATQQGPERKVHPSRSNEALPSFRFTSPENRQTIRRTMHSNESAPTIDTNNPESGPTITQSEQE
jgi:adenylyl- and sulfurtransferase ThiI